MDFVKFLVYLEGSVIPLQFCVLGRKENLHKKKNFYDKFWDILYVPNCFQLTITIPQLSSTAYGQLIVIGSDRSVMVDLSPTQKNANLQIEKSV